MKNIFRHLYTWVLLATIIGGLIGWLAPSVGESLGPVGDGFIALVKMLIAPIIFCTVVAGTASTHDMKSVGRIGLKALFYFEVVSTLALAIGLIVANVVGPGRGFNASPIPATIPAAQAGAPLSAVDFILHIIPKTFVDAFTGSGFSNPFLKFCFR